MDIALIPNYLKSGAASFRQADVLSVLADRAFLGQFSFVHASPPCQWGSAMSACRPGLADTYRNLVAPIRDLLTAARMPYVIEQPERPGRKALRDPGMMCGWSFGRKMYRHRLFESPLPFAFPHHRQHAGKVSPAGHWKQGDEFISVAGHVGNVALAREVMALDWTTRDELKEAIPPYFTYWLGLQLGHLLRKLAE